MNKKLVAAFAFTVMAAVPARPQGPPFVAGLQLRQHVHRARAVGDDVVDEIANGWGLLTCMLVVNYGSDGVMSVPRIPEDSSLAIHLHDSSGALVKTVNRSFGPNFFQQFSFEDVLETPLGANQSVTFEVVSGSAIVYGSAVDNQSGTMSLQLARGVRE
jgi:hypothetical protein